MNSQNETIAGIIGRITAFDRQCKQAEYTDMSEAWDLLYSIRSDLRRVLDPPRRQKRPKLVDKGIAE